MSLLSLHNVSFGYGVRPLIFKDISFDVKPGKFSVSSVPMAAVSPLSLIVF